MVCIILKGMYLSTQYGYLQFFKQVDCRQSLWKCKRPVNATKLTEICPNGKHLINRFGEHRLHYFAFSN